VSAPASLLVVRLSALGDVVLATAVIGALRAKWPSARLEFLAAAPFDGILAWVPGLDAAHAWSGDGLPDGVRARAWDVVVDLSGTGRSRRLLRAVSASRRLCISKQTLRRFAFVWARPFGATSRGLVPVLDRMFATVEPLGVAREGRRPRFAVPDPPPDGPVLLAPGAGRDTKRWPAERFGEIAREVRALGRDVVIAGAESERGIVEQAARRTDAEIALVADPSRIPPLAARCPVAVTNDSGWLHAAEACGARVVAIFGPTHPDLGFAPVAPGSIAIHTGIECSPCDLHGPRRCPKGHHRCMNDVPVARVLDELHARGVARVAA
jgi:heptosyltransferase-2